MDDTIYISLLLVLVGVGSFWLGRSSVERVLPAGSIDKPVEVVKANNVSIKEEDATLSTVNKATSSLNLNMTSKQNQTSTLVASKSGTKYHKLTCPGAKQIKEENKIYFNSTKEAEAAGYSKAANCPD